jgi:hypothetical protein
MYVIEGLKSRKDSGKKKTKTPKKMTYFDTLKDLGEFLKS